ncbi:MAG: DegT/DnrJ/EryC1/StrS family aminotransferase [Planctomycetota bacterium]
MNPPTATEWRIPLSRPDLDDTDRAAVARVLDSPILSWGEQGLGFEREFSARYNGLPCAAVSSGTAGLYLALWALGVDSGEVLTPSYGFIGTAHAIRLAGAEPRFTEVDPDSCIVRLEDLEAAYTPECRAVIPVDLFGTPVDMPQIAPWARERGLAIVQDACEAIGARCAGDPVGVHADASVYGFYPNKQMTTGEGGMVVCRDQAIADCIRSMRNQGRGEGGFDFVREGFNFRLTELQSALGRTQLARLDSILEARDAVAAQYLDAFAGMPRLQALPTLPSGWSRSWFVFPIILDSAALRTEVQEALTAAAIQSAPYFPAIHSFPPYANALTAPGGLPITNDLATRSLAVPFHNSLTSEEIGDVVSVVRGVVG